MKQVKTLTHLLMLTVTSNHFVKYTQTQLDLNS